MFSAANAGTVEAGQNIIGLNFTMSGLLDGAGEHIAVDGSTITLGANSSGTTATNGMTYNVTVAAGTATVVLSKAAGVSTANINTLINSVTYQDTNTDAPSPGNRVFTLTQIQDSGGVANSGQDTTALAIASTVKVVAVNDAPQGTNHTAITLEDTPYTFAAADFGFSDPSDSPANSLLAVEITTLPTAGTLSYNGAAVGAGQFISAADISANKLVFAPGANANGNNYAIFTFQVQDDGGTANGGENTDPTPRTMTMNVIAVNDAPQGADNTVTALEDNAYTFLASDFGFSDPGDNPANNLLSVKISTLPTVGSLTDNGAAVTAGQFVSAVDIASGLLQFTPATNANGVAYANFTFQAQDDGGTANGGVDTDPVARTMSVDVTPINDAPQGINNTVTANEDTAYVFQVTDFGFTDPSDSPSNSLLAVKIAILPTAGSLTVNGVGVSVGQYVSVSDIANGNLQFLSAPDGNGTNYSRFGFQVQDDGGTANGGVDTDTAVRILTIDVAAVNDAPVNVMPGAQNALINTPIVLSGANAISVSDVDANGGLEQITLSVNYGTVTLGGTTGLSFSTGSGTGDATMVFSGTLSDLNSALNGLSYTPANNYFGADTLSVISDDLGNTGNGGPLTATSTVAINVNYSAPGLTTSPVAAAYTENAPPTPVDAGLTLNLGTLNDLTGATVQITGSYVSGEDVLAFTNQLGITGNWEATTGTLTLGGTASIADYQTALRSVRYQDTSDDPSTATRTVTFAVSDGVTNSSTAQQVTVAAVNDAPALAAVPLNPTFQEAAGLGMQAPPVNVFSGAAAATVESAQNIIGLIFNVDGLRDGAKEAIVVDGSTITLGADSTGTTASNGMSYTVTLSGTTAATVSLTSAGGVSAANMATVVSGIGYQNISADNPTAGIRVFRLTQIQDDGGTANGGQDTTSLAIASDVTVLAVNDAPVNGIPAAQTTNVNTSLVFSTTNGNRAGVVDVDANAAVEQVTLSVTHGTLSLSGITGLTLVSGANGSGSMTFRGTMANLNAALNGLSYTPATNYSGGDTLSITSDDQGSTGGGGALSSTSTVGITISQPAPPPVVIVPPPPTPTPTPTNPGSGSSTPSTPTTPTTPPTTPGSSGSGGSGGSPTTGGSAGEPVQPVGGPIAIDTAAGNAPPSTQVLVVSDPRTRGADLVRVQSGAPIAVSSISGPGLGSLAIGGGLTQEAMLPGMQTETLTISSTDPEFARAADAVKLTIYRSTLGNKEWVGELDRMRETVVAEPTVEHRIVGSTVAVTGAMSVGYVIWLLRGGLLLSSLLSSLPAWHAIDPMPVLARSGTLGRRRRGR